MIGLKDKPQYIDMVPDFKPMPKYGHLSEKTPELLDSEDAISAVMEALWALPDMAAIRQAAGDADAAMPPGGPDRYREVKTEFLHFPARDGHLVELKVYKSPHVAADATLMYSMHGGGMCVGTHETQGAENVYAAINRNIVVVSVDYRLAPEHPFPTPIEDCYDGLLWCKENAKTLGINPEKIIVAGSSAGGKLAAILPIIARDNGTSGIIAQVLHFPALCHPKFFPRDKYEFGSYIQNAESCVLNIRQFETFLDFHSPNPTPDYKHSPLLAPSLAGLPPALIQSAGVDILRDESFAYADALAAAGVDVEIHCYKGVPHCFPGLMTRHPHTPVFYERYNAFLKKHATSSNSDSLV
ncbi:alpha/beta hydrolase fold-domain-containing protein [Xylaria bambusicola]|uniref:alpha/beta hydrolase fold-domain-containing protein n=1 Tax=Xylaria bambusicola TaxID=326684 RepID=UPI00200879EA|nr:alpha/beta hydrolase fold-domain-containing protein [Xylaria bambusicola]KAI0521128.1 alpha/beta hydrolase fold-domain-containing protein [Xylaria bambusicola]